MATPQYTIIEHTADIGIRVKAKSLESLFKYSAAAVFELSCRKIKKAYGKPKIFFISLRAANSEELFVCWLNELLSLSQARAVVFSSFRINELDAFHVKAEAGAYPASDYKTEKEIKAATYHKLKIRKKQGGWEAEVIFDV